MGRFFTNVQVRVTDDVTASDVVAAVKSHVFSNGFEEISGDETPDRTVLIAAGDRWVSVYDEATEAQDPDVLRGLCRALSRDTGSEAVGVLMHDGSEVELALCAAGAVTDVWTNTDEDGGDVDAWEPLLVDDAIGFDVWRLFRDRETPASDLLASIGGLVGLDEAAIVLGHRDIDDDDPHYVRLAFRRTSAARPDVRTDGTPAFGEVLAPGSLAWAESDPVDVTIPVTSVGGSARGVWVRVSGSAVDRGLIRLERIVLGRVDVAELQTGDPARVGDATTRTAAELEGGEATIRSFEIPVGGRRSAEPSMAAMVYLTLEGEALEAGTGSLEIEVMPSTHPPGKATAGVDVEVTEPPRRPLRYDPRAGSEPLRRMNRSTYLFALVTLGADHEAAAAVAADVYENWFELLAGGDSREVELEAWPSLRGEPNRRLLTTQSLAGEGDWEDVRRDLAGAYHLAGRMGTPSRRLPSLVGAFVEGFLESFRGRRVGGFSWGRTRTPSDRAVEDAAAHVGLWFEITGDEELDGQIGAAMLAMVNRLTKTADGLQAMMGRWDWTPDDSFETTPYEAACSVLGQITTTRDWERRYLRGVTSTMWLGPQLTERLDADELDDVADVFPCGDGIRIRRRDAATLRALEEALAPILPDAASWRAALA